MNVFIEQGTVKNARTVQEQTYEMRILKSTDLQRIMELQTEVAKYLAMNDLYVSISKEEVFDMLNNKGIVLGVFVKQKLVAFYAALFPGKSTDNLGRDFGFPIQKLDEVMHLEAVNVHPDYRGNGLQKRMGNQLIEVVRKMNRYRYVCATVSPYNIPSIRSTLGSRLIIANLKKKYNDLWRYIFYQDLKQQTIIDEDTLITVGTNDLKKQMELFEKQYYGVDQKTIDNQSYIIFGKDTHRNT